MSLKSLQSELSECFSEINSEIIALKLENDSLLRKISDLRFEKDYLIHKLASYTEVDMSVTSDSLKEICQNQQGIIKGLIKDRKRWKRKGWIRLNESS